MDTNALAAGRRPVRRWIAAALVVSVAVVVALVVLFRGEGADKPTPAAALRVGDHAFTEADLDVRRRVILLKYPDTDNARVGACAQLIQGYLLVDALKALGDPITPEQMEREIARIDRETRDPDGLRRLKEICGAAYDRIGILPDFANRRFFFEVYPNHEATHRDRRREAQRVLNELREGRGGVEEVLGNAFPWERGEVTFSPDRGFEAPASGDPATEPPPDPQGPQYERELFAPTPQGAWVDRVVSQARGFALLRWTGWENQEKGVRKVERWWLPKRDAHDFLWEHAGRVPVWSADAALRGALLETVSWGDRVLWASPRQ